MKYLLICLLLCGCAISPQEQSIKERKAYANQHGYFWLPCPICGEYFGGHETNCDRHFTSLDGRHWSICPKCYKKGLGDSDWEINE